MNEETSTLRSGALDLFCRSIVPPSPWATLGLIHGYGDHSGRHAHALRWLAGRGVACHAVDLRGHGRSAGRRGFVRRWDEYLEDLRAFVEAKLLPSPAPRFLLGHSHGGLVVAAAGVAGLPGIRGCVLTAPYFGMKLAVSRYKLALAHALNPIIPWLRVGSGLSQELMTGDEAMRRDSAADTLMLRSATPRWFLTTRRTQAEVLSHADRFVLPLLLLFGDADKLADVGAAERFFAAAGSTDKTLKVYPGLRHELLREAPRDAVFEDVLNWMRARSDTPCLPTSMSSKPT